ncbi:MAG: hypothetical protein HWE24_06480 [Oceanospirillaceae bacterium]|nr:hypothetical protein [Oceanospirillaceae bacterium]
MEVQLKKKLLVSLLFAVFISSAHSEVLCKTQETVSFSCGFKSKSVSVCRNDDDALIYRFGKKYNIELELESDIHFSRTAFSGGGEGNLTFHNGKYKYVIYSSISNGDWRDDRTREKIERAGIYVVKGEKLLKDIQCQSFSGKTFIHDLPAHNIEEFTYY